MESSRWLLRVAETRPPEDGPHRNVRLASPQYQLRFHKEQRKIIEVNPAVTDDSWAMLLAYHEKIIHMLKKMVAFGVICTLIVTSLLLLAGCATSMAPSERGALTGAGLGAAGGAVFGAIAGSAGKGAFVGSAVGVVAGLMVGKAIEGEQATTPYRSWNGDTAPPPPYAPTLHVEVTPDETEISIDGRRVGLAKELHGPARVPVMAGPHVVEFSWHGFSITETIVASPWTTVLIKRDLRPSPAAVPQAPPAPQTSP